MANFIIRIHRDTVNIPLLSAIQEIKIANITLVSKPNKFGGVCMHKGNQKKFGYSIELSKPFIKVCGSHSYPVLGFKGDYIDIIVKNFPRYPAYYQYKYSIPGYSGRPFPIHHEHRNIEVLIKSKEVC